MASSWRPGHRRAASTPVAWRPIVSSPLASEVIFAEPEEAETEDGLPIVTPAPCASAPVTPSRPFFADDAAPGFCAGPSNGFSGALPSPSALPGYSPPPAYTSTPLASAHETILIPASPRRRRSSDRSKRERSASRSPRNGVTIGAAVAFVVLILSIHLVVALRGSFGHDYPLDGAFQLGSEAADFIAQSVQAFGRACAGLVFLIVGAVPIVLCGRAIDERLGTNDDADSKTATLDVASSPSNSVVTDILRLVGLGRKGHWKESLCLVEGGTGNIRWQRRRCWVETA